MNKDKINIKQVLIQMHVGSTRFFHVDEVKPLSVRMAVSELRKRNFKFTATEKGVSSGINVTRDK